MTCSLVLFRAFCPCRPCHNRPIRTSVLFVCFLVGTKFRYPGGETFQRITRKGAYARNGDEGVPNCRRRADLAPVFFSNVALTAAPPPRIHNTRLIALSGSAKRGAKFWKIRPKYKVPSQSNLKDLQVKRASSSKWGAASSATVKRHAICNQKAEGEVEQWKERLNRKLRTRETAEEIFVL